MLSSGQGDGFERGDVSTRDDVSSLQACSAAADASFAAWMQQYGLTPMCVYLPKGQVGGPLSAQDCCGGLRQTLAESADYTLAYDGPGASIFSRRPHG